MVNNTRLTHLYISWRSRLQTYERDVMLSLSDNNQTDIIEAFNSTSRYLDDLLN